MPEWTPWIAAYAAILSTLVAAWNIWVYFQDRPELEVGCTPGGHKTIDGRVTPGISIRMANSGKRPLTIVASGVMLDTGSPENIASIYDPGLPVESTQGRQHTTHVFPDQVDAGKVRYAWARDATGKVYRSKDWPLRS
jgi:hypothetical protein